jgi:hypothetical protein
MSFAAVSRFLGVPVRCLHGKYVRAGLLPWPDRATLTWAKADVLALWRWFEAQRVGDASVPRPHHVTH